MSQFTRPETRIHELESKAARLESELTEWHGAYVHPEVERLRKLLVEQGDELVASRAECERLRKALEARQRKGHNDSCSKMLSHEFACDCGYELAERTLKGEHVADPAVQLP